MAFFLPFLLLTGTGAPSQITGSFQGRFFWPGTVRDSHSSSLGRLGCCSNVHARIGERGSFIYFISFIFTGEHWPCPYGQINFFTHHHFQNQNMSFSYICHYCSMTPAYRSISAYVPLHRKVSGFFYRILPLPRHFWETHLSTLAGRVAL